MTTTKSDFKPLHNPKLSPVPDLFEWLKKQPVEFQAQLASMPVEVFMRTQFNTYCPHCLIDHKCMTLRTGYMAGTKKGICIQCRYFLQTGRRSTLQH